MKFLPSLIFRIFTVAIFSSVVVAQLTNTSEGKLDRSFGNNGFASIGTFISFPGDTFSIPNGTVFQVHSRQLSKLALLVSKQLANGNVDTTFGQNGLKTVEFATDFFPTSITVQPDGKIVAGGYTSLISTSFDWDFRIVRLNANGNLDSTFGSGGVLTLDYATAGSGIKSSDVLSSILVQPDGKIIVAGLSNQDLGPNIRTTSYCLINRLNSDGTNDLSFGIQGISKEAFGFQFAGPNYGRAVILKLQQDGKILAAVTSEQESSTSPGTYVRKAFLARYLSNGSLDTSFSDDGSIDVGVFTFAQFSDLVILDNEQILALTPYHITRLNLDGTLDQSFGSGGNVAFDPGPNYNWTAVNLAVTGNGKIVICSNSQTNIQPVGVRFIARLQQYWPDGTRDIRFGNNGTTTVELPNSKMNLARISVYNNKLIVNGLINLGSPFTSRFSINRKR